MVVDVIEAQDPSTRKIIRTANDLAQDDRLLGMQEAEEVVGEKQIPQG